MSRSPAASQRGLTIGGAKGHEVEAVDGALLRLFLSRRWRPIPHCTGRYTCRDHGLVSRLHPVDLAQQWAGSSDRVDGSDTLHEGPADRSRFRCWTFDLPGRDDPILVVPLDATNRTGIISYKKRAPFTEERVVDVESSSGQSPGEQASVYVHTLNAPSGFRRKLEALGLAVTDDGVVVAGEYDEP